MASHVFLLLHAGADEWRHDAEACHLTGGRGPLPGRRKHMHAQATARGAAQWSDPR